MKVANEKGDKLFDLYKGMKVIYDKRGSVVRNTKCYGNIYERDLHCYPSDLDGSHEGLVHFGELVEVSDKYYLSCSFGTEHIVIPSALVYVKEEDINLKPPFCDIA